jgi:PAS domain S-box-containing protein
MSHAEAMARLRADNAELRLRLAEAEQTLEAIRAGEVDALVVEGPEGMRVYALEGASNSYRVLMEAMNEGAATLSEQGVIHYCNSRFARMFGAPLQRVMGSSLYDHIVERCHDTVDALIQAAARDESRGEVVLRGAEGEEVPALLSLNAIEAQGCKVLCLVATDLRAQKRSEEMVAAERLARSVLEQAAEAIVVCDERARIIRASRAAVDLSGRNPLLAPFDDVFPLLLTERPSGERSGVAAAALRGESFRAAAATLRRAQNAEDGDAELLVSAAPLYGSDAQPLGCVITMVDVTALREADRRKNEFLAVLSHELRNPLAPIRYALDILQQVEPGGDQARRAQEVIGRQVGQLSRLVDDLLDATRIVRGKIELRPERIELNDLARKTVDDHRPVFARRGVAVEVCLFEAPIFVAADRARLTQVLGNLLQNAAKFTPAGGRATVEVRLGEHGQAEMRVADTGVGVSPELLPHLFEPFAQADRTLERSRGGLGLGLALARGLVELHGGQVRAQSAGPGHGTEVTVSLPVAPPATEPADALRQPHALAGRRILVIEDNVDAAMTIREALELRDNEVVIAYDGVEGVAKAREFKPEVVLCDLGLPRLDGFGVARALRAEPTLASTLLVAVSGYAQPDDLLRAREAGFDHHVAKPPSVGALEELLGRAQ